MANAARNYCFTYNNPPLDLGPFRDFLTSYCTYAIYGHELAPLTGTPHLQGYVQLKEKERLTGLAKKMSGCHLSIAKGGWESNRDYCSKDATGVWTWGSPSVAGKRLGLEDACESIKKGCRLSEIATQDPECYARYHRGLEALSSALAPRRDFKTEIFWYWGATGTGKSRKCADREPLAYWKPSTTKWWNGYEGQEAVIIDDYRRDFCTFAELLRLLDRYPLSVETKGGTRSFVSRRIYITTPNPPETTWTGRTEEDLEQLMRRIDHVEYFPTMRSLTDFELVL